MRSRGEVFDAAEIRQYLDTAYVVRLRLREKRMGSAAAQARPRRHRAGCRQRPSTARRAGSVARSAQQGRRGVGQRRQGVGSMRRPDRRSRARPGHPRLIHPVPHPPHQRVALVAGEIEPPRVPHVAQQGFKRASVCPSTFRPCSPMVYRETEDTRVYSRFSGPMIAQTVFPDGMGELPHIRHRASTISARTERRWADDS